MKHILKAICKVIGYYSFVTCIIQILFIVNSFSDKFPRESYMSSLISNVGLIILSLILILYSKRNKHDVSDQNESIYTQYEFNKLSNLLIFALLIFDSFNQIISRLSFVLYLHFVPSNAKLISPNFIVIYLLEFVFSISLFVTYFNKQKKKMVFNDGAQDSKN